MNQLQEALDETLAVAVASGQIDECQIDGIANEAAKSVVPEIAALLLTTLKRNAPRMLREYRSLDGGFRRRNHKRWRGVLDLLEMAWVISMEIGPEFLDDLEGAPYEHKIDALLHLHARALLVTREIICLLQGGFADGALSRWRSLHEIAVTAVFLSEHDEHISERYLASFHFSSLRAAEQVNKHATRANLQPFAPGEIEQMQKACDALAARLGNDLSSRSEYSWAAPVLTDPNFAKIEEAVGLDHWRPRYRWASQHIHSGHRQRGNFLGLVESAEKPYLIGASNSGFTDPLQMTAISLLITTEALLLSRPKLDNLVVVQILQDLSAEIGPVAFKLERESLEANRRAGSGLLARLRNTLKVRLLDRNGGEN